MASAGTVDRGTIGSVGRGVWDRSTDSVGSAGAFSLRIRSWSPVDNIVNGICFTLRSGILRKTLSPSNFSKAASILNWPEESTQVLTSWAAMRCVQQSARKIAVPKVITSKVQKFCLVDFIVAMLMRMSLVELKLMFISWEIPNRSSENI